MVTRKMVVIGEKVEEWGCLVAKQRPWFWGEKRPAQHIEISTQLIGNFN